MELSWGTLVAAGHGSLKQGGFHGDSAPARPHGHGLNEDVQSRACSQSSLEKVLSEQQVKERVVNDVWEACACEPTCKRRRGHARRAGVGRACGQQGRGRQ